MRGSAEATETGATREPERLMGSGEVEPGSKRQRGDQIGKQSEIGQQYRDWLREKRDGETVARK